MEYFRKCLKCGRYMTPHLQSKFGYVYTLWTCPCGYSEDIGDTRADNNLTVTLREDKANNKTSQRMFEKFKELLDERSYEE